MLSTEIIKIEKTSFALQIGKKISEDEKAWYFFLFVLNSS